MAISQTELHQLYLAYFGRPADFNGMIFYTSNPGATLGSAAEGFSKSDESKALYGENFGADTINKIYLNLFGRDAEVDGLIYWMTEVNSGRLSPALAAWAILVGAQGNDKIVVDKKMAVAQAFFDALNTTPEILGYGGTEDALAAFGFLADIDVDTDLEDKLAEVAAFVAGITNTTPPAPPLGTPTAEPEEPLAELPDLEDAIEFTDGTTADNLAGTKAADTFFAIIGGDDATGAAGDKADGGEEDDTLILQIEGSTKDAVPTTFTTKGIETIRVRNLSGKDQTIDATKFEGATVFVGDYSTGRVYVTNMAATQAGSTLVNASHHNALLSFEYASGVTAATLELQGAKDDVVQIGGAAVTGTTVTTHAAEDGTTLAHLVLTGANNKALTIDASAADIEIRHLHAAAGTHVVLLSEAAEDSEDAPGNITVGDLIGVTEVDASEVQGNVEVHGEATAAFVANFTYVGGEGDDTYHVRGALTGGEIDGGESQDDYDTLYIHGAFVTSDAQADRYKNFEAIRIADGVTQDASLIASVEYLELVDGDADAGTKLTKVSETQAQNSIWVHSANGSDGAITIELEDSSGSSDEVSLYLQGASEDATFNLDNLSVAGVEQVFVEVASTGATTFTNLSGLNKLQSLDINSGGAVTIVTGAVNLQGSNDNAPALSLVDVVGPVTIDASAAQTTGQGGFTITGSLTAENTISDTRRADTITGGDAIDTVTYQGGTDHIQLGGAGDVFNFNGKTGSALAGGPVFTIVNDDTSDSVAFNLDNGDAFSEAAFNASTTDTIQVGLGFQFTIQGAGDSGADQPLLLDGFTFGADANDNIADFDWVIVAGAEAGVAYLFHDSDGSGEIDATDVMVRVTGIPAGDLDDMFGINEGGNLTFTAPQPPEA